MKKTLWLSLLLTLLLVACVSCNNNTTPPTDTTAPDTPEVTTQATETDVSGTTNVSETAAPEPETTEPVHTHAWGDWTTVREATCADAGIKERSCACGEKETQPLDQTSHTFGDWLTINQPTCEDGGLAQRYCSICFLLQSKPLEAAGHNLVLDVAVAPTCTETGLTEGKHCSVCQMVFSAQMPVDALGHTPGAEATCTTPQSCTECGARLVAALGHNAGGWIVDRVSTCVERGSRHKECTVCSEIVQTEALLLVDHIDSDWIVDRPADCTSEGSRHKECTVCGEPTLREAIQALGHTEGDWILDRASTCFERGWRHKECTVCSETVKTEALLLVDHIDSDWIVDTEPTCVNDGSKHQACTVCSTTTQIETIPALGHTEGDWILDQASTCSENGSRHTTCTVCSETVQTETLPLEAHVDGVWFVDILADCTNDGARHKECTVCGAITQQETVLALGHTEGDWILDKSATCLERGQRHTECTACSETLQTEILPITDHWASDWIVDAEVSCENDGSRHKECTICGVTTQQETLLAYGHKYKISVTPPTATDDGYTTYTCSRCDVSYTEAITVTDISITSSNRKWIGYTGASNEKLVIPATFQYSGSWYRITSIDNWAFIDCSHLASVELPDSITIINMLAFQNCTSLTSVTIPSSVTSISHWAFDGCSSLSSIYYAGTKEQWEAISKGANWDRDTGDYTIYYLGETETPEEPEESETPEEPTDELTQAEIAGIDRLVAEFSQELGDIGDAMKNALLEYKKMGYLDNVTSANLSRDEIALIDEFCRNNIAKDFYEHWFQEFQIRLSAYKETLMPDTPSNPSAGTGTEDDPFILTDVNFELSLTGAHDVYYSYTATKMIKINIFYTEGCYVTISGDAEWDKDEGAMMYTVVVFEGGTVILNPWANGAGTYTIIGGGKK